jgi:hypothetical protein
MNDRDIAILRDLAKQYVEVHSDPVQDVRRDLWRQHNSLKNTQPLIYVRAFAWREMPQARCTCRDPFYRQYEDLLRYNLFWYSLGDDSVFEPWITVKSVKTCSGWGVESERRMPDEQYGAFKYDYALKELGDVSKLRKPWHGIDEERTRENVRKLEDAIGDILTVDCDRSPYNYSIGLTDDLGRLRGIEHLMLDMVDHPEWLHELVRFMADGVAQVYDQAEAAGDWGLSPHRYTNQAMPYAEELDDPAANTHGVKRKRLWCHAQSQEFTGVSPAMHKEYILQYQLPVLAKFGLVAYGCCEDLTHKIDMLRQIPNLRRIAVAPFADAARCAEQIGQDYVLSYRPSPADMVSYGWDPDRVRSILKRDLEACRDSHVDITLKDVETVQADPNRVRNWVSVTREVIDEVFG